jgi:hypothetical protein
MWWTSSDGTINLQMTKAQAEACAHPGPCDADVLALSEVPTIRRQLDELDPAAIARELSEWGAWDDDELQDHEQNRQRLLWIAAGEIADETRSK